MTILRFPYQARKVGDLSSDSTGKKVSHVIQRGINGEKSKMDEKTGGRLILKGMNLLSLSDRGFFSTSAVS